jgi:hypothetical protein
MRENEWREYIILFNEEVWFAYEIWGFIIVMEA